MTKTLGLRWAALVLGAGLIDNMVVEKAADLYPSDPQAVTALWSSLHTVELGLGGGNEIAERLWMFWVSLSAFIGEAWPERLPGLAVWPGLVVWQQLCQPLAAQPTPCLGWVPSFGLSQSAWCS